jgi:hypothetical protein
MSRISEIPLGPYAKWTYDFVVVSRGAYSLLHDIVPNEGPSDIDELLFIPLSLDAEATSVAARLVLTYNLAVAAFALLRVRLEQCIICSYLIHNGGPDLLRKYWADGPAALYEVFAKAEDHAHPSTKTRPRLREELKESYADLGGYIDDDGNYKRRWTKLKLRQMAERRDKQVRDTTPFPWLLTDEYWRLYPLASLAVHGVSAMMNGSSELHHPDAGSSELYPYMLPWQARGAAAAIARYDLIQTYETLCRLGEAPTQDIAVLLEQYNSAAARKPH